MGAIAEFSFDADERLSCGEAGLRTLVTERGAMALEAVDALSPIAFEAVESCTGARSQNVAFCLPEPVAAFKARATLTELGTDKMALQPGAREDALFDIGVGSPYLQFCVRTSEPELLAALRAGLGRSILDKQGPALAAIMKHSPTRVAISRAGRIEVFQPIPGSDGRHTSPLGPHTHFLPKLLKTQRTHSAKAPIPSGLVPCLMLYP